jgi:hypothetical protein
MAADGRYWTLLSMIAKHGNFFRLPDDYGLDLLASDLMCSPEYLKEFLTILADINAIDKGYWEKGRIFCLKMAEHADRYTEELIKKNLDEKAEKGEFFNINHEFFEIVRVLAEHPDPRKRGKYSQILHTICTDATHKCTPPSPSPSPSPSPDNPPTPLKGGMDYGGVKKPGEEPKPRRRKKAGRKLPPFSEEFEKFYEAYPNKKGGKEEGWDIWQRRLKNGKLPPFNYLMESLFKLTQDPEWMKEDGRFVPMITSFLRKGRWSDVDGLKSAKSPVHKQPDPNCPYCQGRGHEPDERDGVKGYAICRCRRK